MQPLYEYVCHLKGHRNSKGELAEWVIKSHETGEILSSHKSEQKAKEHLKHMHIFGESVEGEAACSHCGWSADGVEKYNGRLLCPSCLKEFQRLDANRDANGYIKYDNITKRSDGFNPEGYKLIGESNYGTDMDNRVKIFMEGVNQLGLTSSQVEAIGKLTNACMESALELPENFTDEDLANRDDLEERQLDQVYDELWKLGVSTDTINARGRENDFSFNTMYQLLKDVCADKGIPVPEIDGAEDDSTNLSDLWGDPEEPEGLASLSSNEPEELDF